MTTNPTTDRSIFLEAIEIASRSERQAFVERACGSDHQLRAAVEALLAAHGQSGDLLDAPDRLSRTTDQTGARPGTQIGPYKLIEQIGEGGMGTVWMAEQKEPVKRLVALKLIKAGMDSRQVIARFEAERQALALMDHANIARVLDGGTTDAGRPYFVMDLVRGLPITQYCDEHHLTPRQRLELFLPVCQAIQHAHQKGIIHRDLKPSNVMVALYDGKPVPKVIDFGVAKAAGQPLTEQTLVTGFGAIVGTLEYMSPEQAEINQLDIDTRSDIYSLGVLLYELLTGSPPFSRKELEQAGMLEMLRVIREQEPSKPSTKLSSSDALPTLSANRGTEPAKLAKLVRGELDWIVMKALEKDRSRRYETANGFASDIQRYLADEPVQACPPSAAYRFRKFARRHRIALAAASTALAGLLLLVAGLAVSNRMITASRNETAKALHEKSLALSAAKTSAAQAEAEKRRAEASFLRARIAVRDAILVPAQGFQEWSQLPEPLRKKFEGIAVNFYQSLIHVENAEPALRYESAVGYRSLGGLYSNTGRQEEAKLMLRQSIAVLDEVIAESPTNPDFRRQLALSLYYYWHILRQSRSEDSHVAAERTLEVIGRLVEEYPQRKWYGGEAAQYYARIGPWLRTRGRTKEADQVVQRLTNLQLAMPTAMVHYYLGVALTDQGKLDKAIAAYRKAIELDPKNAFAHNNLAWLLATCSDAKLRDPSQAVTLAKKAVELDPTRLAFLNTLGAAYYRIGDWKAAIAALEKSMAMHKGGDSNDWFFLAMAHWQLGEKHKARDWFDRAVQWMDEHQPANEELRRFRTEAAEVLELEEKE